MGVGVFRGFDFPLLYDQVGCGRRYRNAYNNNIIIIIIIISLSLGVFITHEWKTLKDLEVQEICIICILQIAFDKTFPKYN